jgi:putative transposase
VPLLTRLDALPIFWVMPRTARIAPGGMVHVLNRANNRDDMFVTAEDYLAFLRAFLRVMRDTLDKKPMRILSYCLMSNHWHMVLWPEGDGDLGAFMQTVTTTHAGRWRRHRQSVGQGHLYQGTYKSFPVQDDEHFFTVCRYVERNALRANLVERAEAWHYGSLWQRRQQVVRPETEAELQSLRASVRRGRPYGEEKWQRRTAKRLGLESTFRDRGRPKNKTEDS